MKGDWFAITLFLLYCCATLLYIVEGNWSKSMYFGGSAIITLGILISH